MKQFNSRNIIPNTDPKIFGDKKSFQITNSHATFKMYQGFKFRKFKTVLATRYWLKSFYSTICFFLLLRNRRIRPDIESIYVNGALYWTEDNSSYLLIFWANQAVIFINEDPLYFYQTMKRIDDIPTILIYHFVRISQIPKVPI